MNDDMDARAWRLYDEGAARLAEQWDDAISMCRYANNADVHSPRETLAYAQILLRSGDIERASRAIRAALELQERREGHAHEGNFRWFLEDREINDLNGVEFVLDALNAIVREPALPADLAEEIRDAMALGLDEIDRLNVHLTYTNIALSDICTSVLGGEAIGDEAYVGRGERRLDEWLSLTASVGAPHEYNSPTYVGVDLMRMAALAEGTGSPEIALKARIAEELLWLHVAAHYHPELAQLSGPHSRAYFDGWSGAGGYLKLLMWRLLGNDDLRRATPYATRTREEGHIGIATTATHCPAYVEQMLTGHGFPFTTREQADTGLILTSYMAPTFALGSASRAPTVGVPPEPWGQHNSIVLQFRREAAPGYGTLFARYAADDRTTHGEDWWDEGTFCAAQEGPMAIIASGLRPRLRATQSYRMSLNMLGVAGADIRVGGRRLEDAHAAEGYWTLEPGEAVCVAAGDVYVALIPLEPTDMGATIDPIRLRVEGERLTLDIYNYRGPAKWWWEYRSLSGPFYKGNVRNAAVIEVAQRGDFAGIDAFAAHVGNAMIADSVGDDAVREIAYASAAGSVTLRYSLMDMTPVNGAEDLAPARFGAIGGSGAQGWLSRVSLMQLGRAKLLAGTEPKWLIADDGRAHYVMIRPTAEEMPLWFETEEMVVECEAIGISRVEIDEGARAVVLEAAGEMGAVRVRCVEGEKVRLTINGTDVTDALTVVDDETREFAGL